MLEVQRELSAARTLLDDIPAAMDATRLANRAWKQPALPPLDRGADDADPTPHGSACTGCRGCFPLHQPASNAATQWIDEARSTLESGHGSKRRMG